jgi:hypothetical protein
MKQFYINIIEDPAINLDEKKLEVLIKGISLIKKRERERVYFGFDCSLCNQMSDSKVFIAICVSLSPCQSASG